MEAREKHGKILQMAMESTLIIPCSLNGMLWSGAAYTSFPEGRQASNSLHSTCQTCSEEGWSRKGCRKTGITSEKLSLSLAPFQTPPFPAPCQICRRPVRFAGTAQSHCFEVLIALETRPCGVHGRHCGRPSCASVEETLHTPCCLAWAGNLSNATPQGT